MQTVLKYDRQRQTLRPYLCIIYVPIKIIIQDLCCYIIKLSISSITVKLAHFYCTGPLSICKEDNCVLRPRGNKLLAMTNMAAVSEATHPHPAHSVILFSAPNRQYGRRKNHGTQMKW
jgi:hypothetical protein